MSERLRLQDQASVGRRLSCLGRDVYVGISADGLDPAFDKVAKRKADNKRGRSRNPVGHMYVTCRRLPDQR